MQCATSLYTFEIGAILLVNARKSLKLYRFESVQFSFVFDMKPILVWLFLTVVSLGGAACHGCHHFGVTPFGRFFFCFETENPLIGRQKLFFLVFTYILADKGCHHEILPRVPPFLATLLVLNIILCCSGRHCS